MLSDGEAATGGAESSANNRPDAARAVHDEVLVRLEYGAGLALDASGEKPCGRSRTRAATPRTAGAMGWPALEGPLLALISHFDEGAAAEGWQARRRAATHLRARWRQVDRVDLRRPAGTSRPEGVKVEETRHLQTARAT